MWKSVWLGVSLTLHSCECFFFSILNADVGKNFFFFLKTSLVLLRERDKICACCKLLNAWALKHHLPDLEMNSTVITSSTVMCALLALPTITLQSVVFHFWQIMETLTEYSICTFSALLLSFIWVYFMRRFSSFMQILPDLAHYQQTKPEVHAIITCMVISWISERFYMSFELASTKAGWWFGLWKIKESLSVMV